MVGPVENVVIKNAQKIKLKTNGSTTNFKEDGGILAKAVPSRIPTLKNRKEVVNK